MIGLTVGLGLGVSVAFSGCQDAAAYIPAPAHPVPACIMSIADQAYQSIDADLDIAAWRRFVSLWASYPEDRVKTERPRNPILEFDMDPGRMWGVQSEAALAALFAERPDIKARYQAWLGQAGGRSRDRSG